MPFILFPLGAGPSGIPVVPDTCPVGALTLSVYPIASARDVNPFAGLTLGLLLPYPGVRLAVWVYPISTIVTSPNDPIATIECKEHV